MPSQNKVHLPDRIKTICRVSQQIFRAQRCIQYKTVYNRVANIQHANNPAINAAITSNMSQEAMNTIRCPNGSDWTAVIPRTPFSTSISIGIPGIVQTPAHHPPTNYILLA
jgi:hypothetical protein